MTIDKAIEVLQDDLENPYRFIPTDSRVATKLGIEALKQIKIDRRASRGIDKRLLPGETKD